MAFACSLKVFWASCSASSASSCGATIASNSALLVTKGSSISALVNINAFWSALNFTGQWKWASYISRCTGVRCNSTRFGAQGPCSASARDGNDPRETHVHQQRRLFLMREKPDELDGAVIPPFNKTDFLWAGELLVACQPLQRVAKRPGGERCEFDW